MKLRLLCVAHVVALAVTPLVSHGQVTLRGRVLRETDRAPLPDAEVLVPAANRRVTTDSAGAFTIDELPEGRQLVQVRKVGLAVLRDTITLVTGQVVTRDFLLSAQSTLDTVKTVAERVQYISPGLRGFEDRRVNAASGYFIAEAELRKSDEKGLASIILSRVAGLKIVPSRGAAFLASTRTECSGRAFGNTGKTCVPCFVTVYMDGQLVYLADPERKDVEPFDFNSLAVNSLAGVEFYSRSGNGPVGFNATGKSSCGTLLLWTRERL